MIEFVDLQVNGYAGVDFNSDTLDQASLENACRHLASDHVHEFLVTLITAPLDQLIARIHRIATWIESNPTIGAIATGIHIEGPFIRSEDGFVGAHPVSAVIPASVDVAKQLVEAGNGYVKLVTLAPECDPGASVTKYLDDQGIIVAAGHSNASLDQIDASLDAGLRLFTHLGNGCPAVQPRHDNIIQRVLSRADRLMISFIADGHHVPLFALENYLRAIPTDNIVIVSDAISAAGLGPGSYPLSGQTVHVGPDGAAWAECRTHFAGCATPLKRMHEILRYSTDASPAQLDAWMRENPKRLIG